MKKILVLVAIPVIALSACSAASTGVQSPSALMPASSAAPSALTSVSPSPTPTSTPTNDASEVRLRVEWWSGFDALSGGRCKLRGETGWRQDISRGISIVLVGPNDDEMAASTFESGRLEKSRETDREYWANIPKKRVCVFNATFEDVPVEETYRLKYRIRGIDNLSVQRADIQALDGLFPVYFGSKPRD